ncbi:NADH-quinone oxidoreductase subunit NuoK [Myxococcota bacterium]|nr:NADH-quinone oxidoreductase subunit NuoK [Myxococcota bacterium]
MIPLAHLVFFASVLFVLGALAVVLRRNVIVVLMGIELMLNAVNLSFIGFSRYFADQAGHVFVLMVFVVAAVEVGVGIAIIVSLFKLRHTVSIDQFDQLRN